jgi:hypothetical protein
VSRHELGVRRPHPPPQAEPHLQKPFQSAAKALQYCSDVGGRDARPTKADHLLNQRLFWTAPVQGIPLSGGSFVPFTIIGGLSNVEVVKKNIHQKEAASTLMALEPNISEFADFCPICTEMAVLCWSDTDLDEQICDYCAGCLAEAEFTLLKLNLNRPSPQLIEQNP